MATLLRVLFISFGTLLLFLLWRAHRALKYTLGCSVGELHQHIAVIGGGDFSLPIPVTQGMEHSVLGWLSLTQANLAHIDVMRTQAEEALRESEQRLQLAAMATKVVIWEWDIINDAQIWYKNSQQAFGWTDIIRDAQKCAWWVERVHSDAISRQSPKDFRFLAVWSG